MVVYKTGISGRVVDPDPAGSEIIFNLGSGSKFPTNKYKAVKMYRFYF
jgi:hypothetical protein